MGLLKPTLLACSGLTGLVALVAGLVSPAVAAAQATPSSAPNIAVSPALAPTQSGSPPAPANATGVEEIVVTAQKREQSINSVGQSITAVTGDALIQRGITSTADLTKVVPGFNFAPSPFQEPVYVLRGVGFYDSGLGSSPAVTVYLDQVPLPYPVMTEVAPIDLQRVEALKGPQGTLFGQNSTGGAINYIAAKPTQTFEAGADVTYERFDQVQATGFVSGPLSDTLSARLSAGTTQGGAYQYSVTRPNAELGDADVGQGRLLLDWRPTSKLKFELNLNGFYDGSDAQAYQLSAITPVKPSLAPAALLTAPIVGNDPRAADYPPGYPYRSTDSFYQAALRTDYELTPGITVTSLTSYEHMQVHKLVDVSGYGGEGGELNNLLTEGEIHFFSQELRATGHSGPLIWTVGGNYDYSGIHDTESATIFDTADKPIAQLPAFHSDQILERQTINNYAIFGNVDYQLPKGFTLHAGLRATDSDRRASFCGSDPNAATDGNPLGNITTAIQGSFVAAKVKKTPIVPGTPGTCLTLSPAPNLSPTFFHNSLNEDNLSWRVALDYKFDNGTLLYVSDSIGYKSGVISPVLASSTTQFAPVKQERLDDYEIGVKAPLFNRIAQLNLTGFYYSYDDQQLRTRFTDPLFGQLNELVNIPRSQLWGLDGDLEARPFRGLTLTVSGTYIESDVTQAFVGQNAQGVTGNLKGSNLPYTPRVQLVADGQYEFPLTNDFKGFVGASLTHHSTSNATFVTASAPAPLFKLNDYTVLDFRAGVATADGRWRVTGFVRNATNEYYQTTVVSTSDGISRLAGLPLVAGVTLSWRYH